MGFTWGMYEGMRHMEAHGCRYTANRGTSRLETGSDQFCGYKLDVWGCRYNLGVFNPTAPMMNEGRSQRLDLTPT